MSDVVFKYARDHMPSIAAAIIALISAATVLAQKNADIETLKTNQLRNTNAITDLQHKQTEQIILLKEIKTNQEWIIRQMKGSP